MGPYHTNVRILFHAVNGVGLGHVARLSWIARAVRIARPAVSCAAVSSCHLASSWFPAPCEVVPCDLLEPEAHRDAIRDAVRRIRPDVLVFDTRWPPAIPEWIGEMGVRRILVLRAQAPDRMQRVASDAASRFDAVLVPHTQDELRFYYGHSPELIALLGRPPFSAVGPIARVDETIEPRDSVLFTVGAGANYLSGVKDVDDVRSLVAVYAETARRLRAHGRERLHLVAGPMLPALDGVDLGPMRVIRRLDSHVLMSPRAAVVSRGGYNTCWEAIGAASSLVLCSSHSVIEDVGARCRYLATRGFATHTDATAQQIADAVLAPGAPNIDEGRRLVNADMARIARAIAG
jgi:predicted glycosyltransferase